MKPLIAIVGRPNVGKSTLFNRLVGEKLAIVHDLPGVTRDRHYADAYLQGREVTIIDTGGFDPNDEDPMHQGIARHVRAAIAEADVILCLLDALSPPTEADRQAVQLLRKSSKPVVYFANRADNKQEEMDASELHRLGISNLIAGSALHGRRMADLELALVSHLPSSEGPVEAVESDIPKIALIGRPNAGKSSLINQLAGSERSLVDERPGTTRDPVDALITFDGKQYLFVDTAGVRRRSKIKEEVESHSVMRAIRCIERADLVVLMCDGTELISDQDLRLLALATERGRSVIVGLNKSDLLTKSEEAAGLEKAHEALHFAPWIPFVRLSALKGRGTKALLARIDKSYAEFSRRVTTSELNRFFTEVLERRAPPTRGGKAPRLFYVTQAQTKPPLFVAMCNAPDLIDESYKRFVVKQLRDAFGFESVPVRVSYRERRRRESPNG
jgi:GTP-binding protein